MVVVLLCLISCTLGILAGWFLREVRDIWKSMLVVYKKLHYHNNKVARSGVITSKGNFSQGELVPDDGIVELPDYDPAIAPPLPQSAVLRRPSPQDVKAANDKAHKDRLANEN